MTRGQWTRWVLMLVVGIMLSTAPGQAQTCSTHEQCDDGIACTDDRCGVLGTCQNVPIDSICDDGSWCNGTETCSATTGCQAAENTPCLGEACSDETRLCTTKGANEALWQQAWGQIPNRPKDGMILLQAIDTLATGTWQVEAHLDQAGLVGGGSFVESDGMRVPLFNEVGTTGSGTPYTLDAAWVAGVLT
ncbi:MAG: hypothetical protein AAGD38_24860, partial [Acidobacteriota bacterium]